MKMTADILQSYLSDRFDVERIGLGCGSQKLSFPKLWTADMTPQDESVYIVRTGELPRNPLAKCVFVCVGSRPSITWKRWQGDLFYISDSAGNAFSVFNALQEAYGVIVEWEMELQRLASDGSSVWEMVQASIPIFQNRITVVDYGLRILAYCELDKSSGEVQMSERFAYLPPEKLSLVTNALKQERANRNPFFFEDDAGRPINYCINLFFGGNYIGCCALQEDIRPLRTSDQQLFQIFASYVKQALYHQSDDVSGQIMTPTAIFTQLIQCFPVSKSDMAHAMEYAADNLSSGTLDDYKWCCITGRSENRGKNLPESYICETLGRVLNNSFAFIFEDCLVCFCLIDRKKHRSDAIYPALDAYLKDMNFKVGVSRSFLDPFHARDYYLQACRALSLGSEQETRKRVFSFDDCVLSYMLENCCGEFKQTLMIAPELIKLSQDGGAVDLIETLRCYLDNDCNASRAANAMFLHRSTMVTRLETIRRYVNLDSADQKLYLRICLHLPEIDWEALNWEDTEDSLVQSGGK